MVTAYFVPTNSLLLKRKHESYATHIDIAPKTERLVRAEITGSF